MYKTILVATLGMSVNIASAVQGSAGRLNVGTYAALRDLPDWSGTWALSDHDYSALGAVAARAPYRPGYEPSHTPETANAALCLPTGLPGSMAVPLGYEFLFNPGRVTILSEEGPLIRRVYTDGRSHLSDPTPTYAGDSIGHWEAQTLVIDTIALTPKTQFFKRVKTSGQTHMIERIHLLDHNHMQVETIIEDPVALTTSWRYSVTYSRSSTPFMESYYCDDNRDAKGEPDLRPPE